MVNERANGSESENRNVNANATVIKRADVSTPIRPTTPSLVTRIPRREN
jgi:hypothetical protein